MFRLMRKILVLVALVFAFGSCARFPAAPINMGKLTVFERMVNSVVELPGCTGVVLKNDGQNVVVLTAAHCVLHFRVEPRTNPEVYNPVPIQADLNAKTGRCLGTVAAVAHERDLAVVTAAKCKLPTATAVLAKSLPKLGETIYAIGHPLILNYVLTKGIMSRPIVSIEGTKFMVISAPIIYGNSGGPVVNGKGEVVGVVTNVVSARVRLEGGSSLPIRAAVPHLGLAVPLDEIKQFLCVARFTELTR